MSTTPSLFVPGFGTSIAFATYNDSSGTPVIGTYTAIAQSMDVNSPSEEGGTIKITNNQSPGPSGGLARHEYAPGLVEPGDTEFDVIYYKSKHLVVVQMANNGVIYIWQITFSDTPATLCTFTGFITGAPLSGKTEDDAMKGKIKIKVTGPVVWT
jgi:hypothetical protein